MLHCFSFSPPSAFQAFLLFSALSASGQALRATEKEDEEPSAGQKRPGPADTQCRGCPIQRDLAVPELHPQPLLCPRLHLVPYAITKAR